jgi:hypothetical protein
LARVFIRRLGGGENALEFSQLTLLKVRDEVVEMYYALSKGIVRGSVD